MGTSVLVIENGGPSAPVAERWGSFTEWFRARLPTELAVLRHDGRQPLPAPESLRCQGVILSGSVHDVGDAGPWAAGEGRWALAVADRLPVLAVCFGHQLVAEALGGAVGRIPSGAERGGILVQLTAAGAQDPLFAGIATPLRVHSSHRDEVRRAPPGAVLLGSTSRSRWQAYAWGPRLRCVQFHPEFAPGPMATILDSYGCTGSGRPEVWKDDVGQAILENWVRHWLPDGAPAAPRATAG